MLSRLFRRSPALVPDRIVSLGSVCEVAYQVRRLARSERAYPFDWWVTPLGSVLKVLEAGAPAVFEAAQLMKVPDYGGERAFYSRLSGTVHRHEFPAGEDYLALDEAEMARRLIPKYEALQARLMGDCAEGTTLFVRKCLPEHDPNDEALEETIDHLHGALAAFAADPRLLLLDYGPVRPRPWLMTASVPRLRDHNDLGSKRGWNRTFRTLGIACRSGRKFRFDDLIETLESPS
ncbi:DUF1796 family putative cysteine peptidase [Xanthobacter flavus]|uniref:DUF1796 family putative cysteine peptidase n=1 Tax=Xanthobacter flavus TaxID=281 RepID=UPI003727BC81